MSIIIRLQNFPWSADSTDIRQFFAGLKIPDGGVHIVGGEKGDAFIAFNTDEDARLAMKKDGGKIKNARIKLFLSSRTEMQQVIDRVTKEDSPIKEMESSSNEWSFLEHLSRRDRSPRKDHRKSRSRSPSRYHAHRSESRTNIRYKRTPSPYKRSQSPQFQKENSPFERIGMPSSHKNSNVQAEYIQNNHKLEIQPEMPLNKTNVSSYSNIRIQSPFFQNRNENPNDHKEFFLRYENLISNLLKQDFKSEVIEDKFEPHIKEELLALKKPKSEIPFIDDWKALNNQNPQDAPSQHNEMIFSHQNRISTYNDKYEQTLGTYSSSKTLLPPFEFPSLNMQTFSDKTAMKETLPQNNYVIRIAGIDPSCSYRDIQFMLKGIFAPQINMQWEYDKNGYKTDVVYIKLTNEEDFIKTLNDVKHDNLGKSIDISPCPDFIANRYFPLNLHSRSISPEKINESCYMLKGLPFEVTYKDLIKFFQGLKIADLFIIYNKNGSATGTGFVAFNDPQDFQLAMELNGKKIGQRYIELILTHRKDLVEARNKYGNQNVQEQFSLDNKEQKSFSDRRSSPTHKRPLCALITGLPPNVQIKQISDFFSEFGLRPYAIHIMLNNKHNPIGRAYVEFIDLLDFDLALKCHGKSFQGNIICIKQILYDEMITILDNQLAQHSFGNLNTAFHEEESNLPEKVPYLWEPPDEQDDFIEDQNQKQSQNKEEKFSKRNVHDYHHMSNIDNQKLINPHLKESLNTPSPKKTIGSENKTIDTLLKYNSDMDKYFSRESEPISLKNTENPDRSPNLKDSKTFHEINFFLQKESNHSIEENEMNSKNRIPVKFEVKIKPSILKKTKTDEIFEQPISKEDDAKKLSHLSPEKLPWKKLSRLSPDKPLSIKTKSSNKEEKNIHSNKKDMNLKTTNDIEKPKLEIKKDDGASRSKDKTSPKTKIKKFNKNHSYFLQRKTNSYQYNPSCSKSNQRFGNSNKNYKNFSLKKNNMTNVRNTRGNRNDQGCVVQVSNVHPSIGAKELIDFFHGFDFIENKFIRKFNAHREPTREIRVTFRNSYQAKKAVKNLNGCRLRGDRIEMFIVN